jgi:phosphatidate phosphatase APP1
MRHHVEPRGIIVIIRGGGELLLVMEFTQTEHFPWATFSLKMIRFKDKTIMDVFKKGTATKPKHIEPILKRYPGRKFILVGDNGEQDPEVYAKLMRKYPEQIIKILIRNVTQASASDSRFQTTFQGLKKEKWQLFDNPGEINTNVP